MLRSRLPLLPPWLAIATCAALPYLVALHTFPLPTYYSEFAAGVCWAVLAVVVLALTWRNKMGLPPIALAPLALICVLFLQLQLAPPLNPFLSLAATVFLLAAAAACGLGARCRSLPGALEAFAFGLILGGLPAWQWRCCKYFALRTYQSRCFQWCRQGRAGACGGT